MCRQRICRVAVLAFLLASCQDFLIYDVFLEPLSIDPGSALIYSDESATFSASGGRPTYVFSVVSGGGSIDPVTGVYTAPSAVSEVVIEVSDATGKSVRAGIEVLGPRPVVIAPSAVSILVGNSCVFAGFGGIPPYSYVVYGDGSIDSSTGVFTAAATAGTSTVTLTDARGLNAIATISIHEPQTLRIMPALASLTVSSSAWFMAVGGQPPYVFTQASGSGSMSAAGLYTAGTSSETAIVMVTDALGSTNSATVAVVAAGALGLDAASTSVEEGKTMTFTAHGGTPGYSYSLSTCGSGGGIIDGTTGKYMAGNIVGSNLDTVRVTDSHMPAGMAELNVTVLPAAPSGLAADGSYGNPHEIALSWTDNSLSEDGFIVERKSGAGSFAAVGYTAADVSTFVDATCAPNVGYTYRIKAYKGALDSGSSNEAYDLSN